MKLYVNVVNPVMVIDSDSTDWNMNGRQGTSYKAYCHQKVDGKVSVEEIRVTEEVFKTLEPMKKYLFSGEMDVKNNRFVADKAIVWNDNKPNPTNNK